MKRSFLDHLAIVAPTLEEGIAHVHTCLGVEPGPGGQHPLMGTHNRLVQLGGGRFLEVIAVDPEAPQPAAKRWFGLSDQDQVARDWQAGKRLKAYIVRSRALAYHAERQNPALGTVTRVTRGDLVWHFGVTGDGSMPLSGAGPNMMDWGERGSPVDNMAERGLHLRQFVVETAEPDRVGAFLADLQLADGPELRQAAETRLFAVIDTPDGPCLLT